MEGNNAYDDSGNDLDVKDVFQEEMSEDGSRNLNAIILYSYATTFLIEPTKPTQIESRLLIDKKSGRMKELGLNENIPQNYESRTTYSAFMGIMHISDKTFLLVADKVKHVCKLENNDIFYISSVSFLPFEDYSSFYPTPAGKNTLKYIFNIRKLFKQGYYFSYTCDLTLSKQKRSERGENTETRYQWNKHILKDVVKAQVSKKWQLPIVQGYIGFFDAVINERQMTFYLISRRCCHKAGTRFTVRGLDDEGNVANFVETEQIVYMGGYCCSHVQLRGSAPIFWQQRGMSAQVKVTRSFEFTNTAFMKHIEDLNKNWGRIICLNLMSKAKKDEQAITTSFEEHMKNNNLPDVRYEFFDFHQEVKGQKFDKVNPKVESLRPVIEKFGFFVQHLQTGEVKASQTGVVRTNCLDCLDRTNFFQSKIAVCAFNVLMRQMKVDLERAFGQDPLYEVDNTNQTMQHSFILNFKKEWASNADVISMHYAGTGSVISAVTKTGKRTFMGFLDHGMKTINRFYIGNFEDKLKQNCIDLLLGQHTETATGFGDESEKVIVERIKEFAEFEDLTVFTVTWNLGGYQPYQMLNLGDLFNFQGNDTPDLVVIGLQEFIELNAANVVMAEQGNSKMNFWKETVSSNLKQFGEYMFVKHQNLVGILMLIFAKSRIINRIKRVESDIVKTGLGGNFGNKGGAVIRMYIDDTSLCFINCHLESGNKANNTRLSNIVDIHQKAFQQEGVGRRREERIMNLDYKFLIGDMNFRLDYGNFETKEMLAKCTQLASSKRIDEALELLEKLQGFDQFNQSRNSNQLLSEYKEGRIKFLPTYKYDANSNIYDTSKKQRTPSWTDRIMWSCSDLKIQQLFYSRREYKESDHRPVVSYFVIEVKKIDKVKREQIVSQVYQGGVRTVREEEVIEDENYDGGNPYDEREYFADDPYMSPSHNPNLSHNNDNNASTQQIANKLNEINLLDDNEPNGNNRNFQQQQQQSQNNNNPFNSNFVGGNDNAGNKNIFDSFGGFGNFGSNQNQANQGNAVGFNSFASFNNTNNNNYQPQQQSFNNNPFSNNSFNNQTSNNSASNQIDLL